LNTTGEPQGKNRPQPVTGRTRDLVILADKAIFQLAKHWLAVANLFWGLYVFLPILAPAFMNLGWTTPANVIYTLYRPACHQRPERSYFIGGESFVYTPEELTAAGLQVGPFARDIGNEAVGWKVAFCERDVAIYGSILVAGLAYGLLRRRMGGWKMRFLYFVLFMVPMGLDGVLQLFPFHESNWWLRTLTGVIFGVGAVIFAYPYLQEGFDDILRSLNRKLDFE
jgi:uncharacterized membrane protein